ncbi:MAG: proton-conducting membrane transporter [Eubacterium sp.]|nr:proton-conducting membrane transporter [Eubacterium sp.]MCM1214831.1 proton-conducting membrane transporter [Lachnospiraceae bacterium]MCM1238907.1 proton-conducting membrane transporter [Lachnospiraceae bacterium]
MNKVFMLIVILLPMLSGALVPMIHFRSRKAMCVFIEISALIDSVLVFLLLQDPPAETLTVFRFTGNLSVTLRIDGMGGLFAGMAAFLWPLALLYSFEYMKHEQNEKSFFLFYVITYGITLGIALAENILTMYFFFEMLSMVTLPLIMHTRTREAILASRSYLYYMLGGAAFAFIGMIFILMYGTTSSFVMGGVLDPGKIGDKADLLLLIYVLCFCGFSVKTAMFPFSSWLPKAGVAPTPVTALLHAVAVVNTGAFATMRVTYFSFGTELLRGTWAQDVVMTLVIVTIVYGCSRALKETHIKRRLAWSTVGNLSYVLFGVVLMTPLGLAGGMAHMLFHSFMKICSFFCAGAVICKTGRNYVHELNGLGRKMPKVFVAFTISALALMGVPGLCGFVSKWNLCKAAVASENPLAYAGVAALMISALLTAVYMLTIVIRAFFPGKDFDYETIADVRDPGWLMILPLVIFVAVMFCFGLHSGPVMEVLWELG